MRSLALLLGICLTTLTFLPQRLLAQTASEPKPSDAPLQLNLLKQPNESIITANTISQTGLTTPSLWLARDNSENKLLDNWIAYPATGKEPGRIDLLVNQQVWSILDNFERYGFVNRLGSVARNYGYNVRVYNYQQDRLATYTCNFSTTPASCSIELNSRAK